MNRRAVVLFTGDPRREEARKQLPPRFLSALHNELTRTISRCSGTDLLVASERREHFELVSSALRSTIPAATLGRKVEHSLRFAFALGYESVLLVAGDIVGLTVEVVEEAFVRLEQSEKGCVIAPSADGGFSLAGFNHLPSIDWQQIAWFTGNAARTLECSLRDAGVAIDLLAKIDDIDSRIAARRIVRRLPLSFAALRNLLESILSAIFRPLEVDHVRPTCPATATRLRAPPSR